MTASTVVCASDPAASGVEMSITRCLQSKLNSGPLLIPKPHCAQLPITWACAPAHICCDRTQAAWSGTQGPETTPMSRLVSTASDRDAYRPVRPFPLVRTMLGLVAALNVTSATAMLLSL